MFPAPHERLVRDEAEMREFYRRMGLSNEVIERAVRVRFKTPPEEQYVDRRGGSPTLRRGRPPKSKPER